MEEVVIAALLFGPPVVVATLLFVAFFRDEINWRALWAAAPLAVPALLMLWAAVFAAPPGGPAEPAWALDWMPAFWWGGLAACAAVLILMRRQRWFAASGAVAGVWALAWAYLGAAQQVSGVWL